MSDDRLPPPAGRCAHCGEPAPNPVTRPGPDGSMLGFCCAGCAGLHEFGRAVATPAAAPIPAPAEAETVFDVETQKGMNPEETWAAFYRLAMKWRPYMVGVESIAYQQMLAWYFRKKMGEIGTFWTVREVEDRRKKRDRILQEISGLASNGMLYVNPEHTEWISQYQNWHVSEDNDLLDSSALALALSGNLLLTDDEQDFSAIPLLNEDSIPALEAVMGCP